VNPAIYRAHLFPWVARLAELCRRRTPPVPLVFHSDGKLCFVALAFRTDPTSFSFSANVCGMAGVLTGYLVGLVQISPEQEHPLPLCGISLRTRHFPLLAVAGALLLGVLIGFQPFLLSLTGFVSSWVYLRYMQPHLGGIKGDAGFTLRQLAPDFLRPLCDGARSVLSRHRGRNSGSGGHAIGEDVEAMRGTAADIERRRSVALRAIDQRLQQCDAAGALGSANASTTSDGDGDSKGSFIHYQNSTSS